MSFLCACLPCIFPSQPTLQINRHNFKIIRLLGEGGFSYVYLVSSASDGALYALKKIRCPFGAESVKVAMVEVSNYKEFNSPYIIRAIDSSIVQEQDGSKTVYIILPYFENGSLQDIINNNAISGSHIEENEAIRLFIGICRGLANMHRHQNSSVGPSPDIQDFEINDLESELTSDFDSLNEQDRLLSNQSDIDSTGPIEEPSTATELSDIVAYAHRDIKPANIMMSKDGLPVLCDLGSCAKAKMKIKTRNQAMTVQELAAEHCTLPYRAPELLDIKTNSELDEKIDIWSLGCTLYALLYGLSPFEHEEIENGGNLTLAISSGKFEFPKKNDFYSEEIKDLISRCLIVDPKQRPSVEQVLSRTLEIQQRR